MTVVVAFKAMGGVQIASDTIASNGYIREPCGPKWVECGKFWVGCAGSFRAKNLVGHSRRSIAKFTQVWEVADWIRQLIVGDKDQWEAQKAAGDPLKYNIEFIVTDGVTITNMSGDLSYLHDVPYAAIGSGAEAALGARHAIEDSPARSAPPYVKAGLMIEAAVSVSRTCGGQAFRHFIPGVAPP